MLDALKIVEIVFVRRNLCFNLRLAPILRGLAFVDDALIEIYVHYFIVDGVLRSILCSNIFGSLDCFWVSMKQVCLEVFFLLCNVSFQVVCGLQHCLLDIGVWSRASFQLGSD